MSDKTLTYNCRLELGKPDFKTSNQIGLPYIPAKVDVYDKLPVPNIPVIRWSKKYEVNKIYTMLDGYRTTYDEFYQPPTPESNLNFFETKLPLQIREYHKCGRFTRPKAFGDTEYKTEYSEKPLPKNPKVVNLEKMTTCPMIAIGRDEREPVPLSENCSKYLDIYVSTSKLAHRPFTLREQKTIANKDVVTTYETMDFPKGRPFGCKFPLIPGQDLDNRDRNMIDKNVFKHHDPPYKPNKTKRVPNFGSESEMHAAYKQPSGLAYQHNFHKFVEFPQGIDLPSAKQTLCAPGMYTAESSVINNQTSPQVVV